MGSDCATKQKNSPAGRRAERNTQVNTLSLDSKAATKVIAKACTWADRRKDVAVAPARLQRKAQGRLDVSGDELAEAVEKYRKAGSNPP